MVFLPRGNYVDMCKRYRRYAIDTGLYVSLKDKIAERPVVQNLIGRPVVGMRVLRNVKQGSATYDPKDASKNYRLVTFEQNIQRLHELVQGTPRKWPADDSNLQRPRTTICF